MMEVFLKHLFGPTGGLVAMGFGVGSTITYAFIMRTIVKGLKEVHEKDMANLKRYYDLKLEVLEKRCTDNERELAKYADFQESVMSNALKARSA